MVELPFYLILKEIAFRYWLLLQIDKYRESSLVCQDRIVENMRFGRRGFSRLTI
jgi:hypothetical protein